MESPNKAGRRPTSWPVCSRRRQHCIGPLVVRLPATDTLSLRREPPRSTSHPFRHTPRTTIPIARAAELASTVAHRHQAAVLLAEAACAREVSGSCGGDACSAAQGRRAAKWGQAAYSLPMAVWMRRPVALAGDSNLFTPNRGPVPSRCAPAWRRTTHVRPRGMSRRERLGGANRAKQQLLPLAPPHCHPVYSAEADSRRAWGPPSSRSPFARPSCSDHRTHAVQARARARATEFLTRVRLIDRIVSHLWPRKRSGSGGRQGGWLGSDHAPAPPAARAPLASRCDHRAAGGSWWLRAARLRCLGRIALPPAAWRSPRGHHRGRSLCAADRDHRRTRVRA